MLDANSVPRLHRKARLVWDAIDARHMLVFPEAALALQDTASEILKCCDGATSIRAIAENLAARYQADVQVVQNDILEFLTDLFQRGLLDV